MTDDEKFKKIISDEYKRCAKDPVYFFKKYCYIQHPEKGKIKFNLYPFQEITLGELSQNDYSIILKSRQLGISTLTGGMALHLMIFNSDKNILVIATKQSVAKNLITKVRYMYDNLPSWLKEPYVENNKLNLKLSNGSQIKAESSAGDAGRSEAVSMLIIDEAAFIQGIDIIWGSAQQTLACIDKNSLVLTDNGLYRFDDLKSEYFNYGFNNIDINIVNRNGDFEKSDSFYISKESDTLEIEFEDGNRIITTKKHPLLKKSNSEEIWEIAENLNIGSEIKCLYNTNIFGEELIYPLHNKYHNNDKELSLISNDDMAYFVGLWIAEGHFGNKKLKSSSIGITNTDAEICDWLINKFGFKKRDDRHLEVTFSQLYNRLIWIGCERGAHNKHIPNKILHSSMNEQIAFLQGMFDGDGCATTRGNIKYSSVSKQLILDLHHVLLNFGIKSVIKYIDDTDKKRNTSTVVRSDYIYKGYNLIIYGENARLFFEKIGFRLYRKQKRYIKNINNGSKIEVNSNKIKDLILKSGYSLSYFNNNIVNISRLLWFNSKKITKYTVDKLLNACDNKLIEYKYLQELKEESSKFYFNKIISIKDTGKRITYDLKVPSSESFIANFIINHNTGGRAIVLSTPNGMANWFHKEWIKAKDNKGKFRTIKLHWSMHPDRDQEWRDAQEDVLGKRLAAQECDADFLASGNTVVDPETLKFYRETFVKVPLEKRGPNKELWIWESPSYTKSYIVSADVARGDGSDYSAAHVIEVESMTQVAEFKGAIDTKEFGNFLVGLSTEYNDALLVIENANIGWATIQQVINRHYANLYYTEQDIKYLDPSKQHFNKLYSKEKKAVAGFTTSTKTRPLMVSKLEEYFRTRNVIFQSERGLDEIYAFIWNGQKAEAMKGYNDDLVLSLMIGLWVRDTALQLFKERLQISKVNLDNFHVTRPENTVLTPNTVPAYDQWHIPTGHPGEDEDISKWLL